MARKTSTQKQLEKARKKLEHAVRDAEKAVGRRTEPRGISLVKRAAPMVLAAVGMAAGAFAFNRLGQRIHTSRFLSFLLGEQVLGLLLSLTPLRRYRFLMPVVMTVISLLTGRSSASRRQTV